MPVASDDLPEQSGRPLEAPDDVAKTQSPIHAEADIRELATSSPPVVNSPDSPRAEPHRTLRNESSERAELTQRCTDAVQQSAQHNRPIRVRLHRPEWGALQVEIAREENGVAARLQVQSAAARDALAEHLSDLRHSLTKLGLVVDRIDVQIADSGPFEEPEETHSRDRGDSSSQDPPERQGDQRRERRDETSRRNTGGPEHTADSASWPDDGMDIQV